MSTTEDAVAGTQRGYDTRRSLKAVGWVFLIEAFLGEKHIGNE